MTLQRYAKKMRYANKFARFVWKSKNFAPNDRTKLRQLRDHADLAEGARREAKWREAGYHIISMKNDFKTIYGYGVEKTDFVFE